LNISRRHISRKSIILVVLLVAVVCIALVEVYLHKYMNSLPLLSIPEAYRSCTMSFEGTRITPYSCYGCSVNWLMFYRIEKPTSLHSNYVFIWFVKVAQNSSFLVQTLDIVPSGLEYTLNGTDSSLYASLDAILYATNYTGVRIRYDLVELGTYDAIFDLTCRVYAKTLVGYLPIGKIAISVGETLHYSPSV